MVMTVLSEMDNPTLLNVFIPGEYLDIFKLRQKKKRKEKKEYLKILPLDKEGDMLKTTISNSSINTDIIANIPHINTSVIEKFVVTKVDTIIANENKIGKVNITDEETTQSQSFDMIEIDDIIQLINPRGELCGIAEDWEDFDDKIPENFKNKDNLVLKPDGCGENILSFSINRNSRLSTNTYREYKYLEDHYNLQKTNMVLVEYNSDFN